MNLDIIVIKYLCTRQRKNIRIFAFVFIYKVTNKTDLD